MCLTGRLIQLHCLLTRLLGLFFFLFFFYGQIVRIVRLASFLQALKCHRAKGLLAGTRNVVARKRFRTRETWEGANPPNNWPLAFSLLGPLSSLTPTRATPHMHTTYFFSTQVSAPSYAHVDYSTIY